ncbi:hypothetical protein PybrP1_007574 [[Pythium] brassicae (nom. inval.)]|nr:hypothetical protein PybrP1_007574 [[Pythium] brassicae (nom. inval.)]
MVENRSTICSTSTFEVGTKMTDAHSSNSSTATAAAELLLLRPVEVAPKRAPQNKKDACTWFENSKCSAPRGCEVCLNTALRDHQCGVRPSGMCTDMAPLPASTALNSTTATFPSANFTYCDSADAVCMDCKAAWAQEFKDTGAYPLGRLCQGERGCVCLSQCESPSFSAKVITSECSLFGDTAGVAKQIYSAACVFGLFVVAYSIYRAWQKEKGNEGACISVPRSCVHVYVSACTERCCKNSGTDVCANCPLVHQT